MAGRHDDVEVMMMLVTVRVVVKPERKKENVMAGKCLQFRGTFTMHAVKSRLQVAAPSFLSEFFRRSDSR